MKKVISIFLIVSMVFCLSVTAFAEDTNATEADLRATGEKNAITFAKAFKLIGDRDPEKLTAVLYPTLGKANENGEKTWIGIVYDDEKALCSLIMREKNGSIYGKGTATGSPAEGIKMLKEKFGVSDEDIALTLTMEGFYASMNGNTDEMYRVGHRAYYNPADKFVDKCYTREEISRARVAQSEYMKKIVNHEIEVDLGNTNIFPPFDELIKPAFPTWGYFAIGGAVLVLLSVLFIVKSKKKAKNN